MKVGDKVQLTEKGVEYCRRKLRLYDTLDGELAEVTRVGAGYIEVKFDRWALRNADYLDGTWILTKDEVKVV